MGTAQSKDTAPRLPQTCAGMAVSLAVLALAGWLTGARYLAGQWGDSVPMAPSTALAFLFLGGGLFSFARWPAERLARFVALAAASVVSLLALLVLAQFLTGVDLGVEPTPFRGMASLGATLVERMSPLTACVFLLESATLFLLFVGLRWRRAPIAAALLAAGASAIGIVILTGYAYGAPLLFGGTFIPVAMPTALTFVLVGLGQVRLAVPGVAVLRAWRHTSLRGRLLRAFLPASLLLIVIEGWADVGSGTLHASNPALWHSLMALVAGALVVVITGSIARHAGDDIETAHAQIRSLSRFPDEDPSPVLRFARDGTLLYANRSSRRLLEYWRCEQPGQVLPEPERQRIAEVLAHSGSRDHEVTCGEIVYWLVLTPVPEMGYVNIYGRDVTERRQAEDALRAAQEQLEIRVKERTTELAQANRALQAEVAERKSAEEAVTRERQRLYDVLDTLPVYVLLLSADYHVPFANRFFRERFGTSEGRHCYEFLFHRDAPCETCETYKVLETAAPHFWEWIGPDGRNYDIFDFPFTGEGGAPLILEVGIDITERKRAKEALQQAFHGLEQRVAERTENLRRVNEELRAEVAERKQAEESLRQSRKQLRALAARLQAVREEERIGIARELHDELGQALTGMQIDLMWLDGQLRNPGLADLPALRDKVAALVPRTERLIETTHSISSALRPGMLDDLGLVAAVEWLAADFAKRTGLACTTALPSEDIALNTARDVALFRIVQEALTNVVRHAHATCVEVRLCVADGELLLDVQDNGRGATPEQIAAPRSLGLLSMRERAAVLGGTVDIQSEPGRGTTVRVRVPSAISASL